MLDSILASIPTSLATIGVAALAVFVAAFIVMDLRRARRRRAWERARKERDRLRKS